jgi:large subunit ribosomal protein LP0
MPPKKEEKKDEKKGGKDEKKAGGKEPKKAGAKKKRQLTEEEIEAMKPRNRRKVRKARLKARLEACLSTYDNALIVNVDNVGSHQLQKVRLALRGKADILMGKNTIIRSLIREYIKRTKNNNLTALLPHIAENIGLVFSNDPDLNGIRKTILEFKVPAAAKVGADAPDDVFIEPGPTGLDPGQTNFFQALNIPTKIAKGSIEIANRVHLIKKGEKVNASVVALLAKLDKKPFFYGIKVLKVFEEGSVYDTAVLDIKPDDLISRFLQGIRYVAALGLRLGQPNAASVPHSVSLGFKYLLAISLATNYTFKEAQQFKDFLANPGAFASTSTTTTSGGSDSAAPKEAEKEAAPKEEEEEGDMGFSLFD